MKLHASYVIATIVFLVISACGPSQAEMDAISTRVADEIFASQTAAAPAATLSPIPTSTLIPTNTTTPTITATSTNSPTPTPTNTPTLLATSIPFNAITVVALQKLNLRTFTKTNAVGNPIMVIYEPRVQYFEGETFQVFKQVIFTDGGDRYYLVIGPRGAGLYVRITDVAIVN